MDPPRKSVRFATSIAWRKEPRDNPEAWRASFLRPTGRRSTTTKSGRGQRARLYYRAYSGCLNWEFRNERRETERMTLPGFSAEASIKNATGSYSAEQVQSPAEGTATIQPQQLARTGALDIPRPTHFDCTVSRREQLCYYDENRRRVCVPFCCSQTCFFPNRAPVFNVPCQPGLPACR
jgi:hypothetical protein